MARVAVNYQGLLSVALRVTHEEVDFSHNRFTVLKLLDLLAEKHGEAFRELVLRNIYHVVLSRDDHSDNIQQLSKYDTELQNGDAVSFIYPSALYSSAGDNIPNDQREESI